MSGIKFALQHVIDHRCHGIVKALGQLCPEPGHASETRYAIIKIIKDRRLEVWYDYNDDVRLSSVLKLGEPCELQVRNNSLAEWVPASSVFPSQVITAEDVYRVRGVPPEVEATNKVLQNYLARRKGPVYAKNGKYK